MMKSFKEKTVPVPRRGKVIFIMTCVLLMAASIVAGITMAPNEKEFPVILANGDIITPPWYITIDGEKVALVDSKETAQRVLADVIHKYDDDELILDVEVKEDTGTEKMDIENGDEPPHILTAQEAEKLLLTGDGGESYITVVTTEEQTAQEAVDFTEEYKPEPDMYVGETKVEVEGKEGTKEVVKKIVKENGQKVEEEILDEEIVSEPQEEVILTGTKQYDGYGGATGNYSGDNVSYVDIEPEEKKQILACQLPKLCLQPLVENAILHAFNEITTGGRVTLKAFCTDGNLSIVVADNGSGMSPEQLKKLDASIHAEHVEEGKEHGIGLHNVNRRIQLLFGKEYGLSVKSFSGIGTFVEVFLPMRTEPFDEE